jgi:hypothetical protein
VCDFLWEYYSWRPAQLERWHPGPGVVLAGDGARAFLRQPGYVAVDEGVAADAQAFPPNRIESVRWIRGLLRACADRPAYFACFGLHEWAMVYRAATVRHADHPLRLSPEKIDRFVESMPVRCSHFDAFRFFTPEARPLNRQQPQPSSESRPDLEQRGCVHVTMDLYKWSTKLVPFVASELIADAFELALAARELDMRASPYDLRALGFDPVCIEIPEGRAAYEAGQRALAERAVPIRRRLIAACACILDSRGNAGC